MTSGTPEDLTALLAGRAGAWERFVRRYSPVIYGAILRKLAPLGRGEDADDVAQDVFVRLCRNDFKLLRGFDPSRARLTTWLTVITSSTVIDHLRRQRGQHDPIEEVAESRLAVDPVEPDRVKIPEGLLSPRQALVMELLYQREYEVAEAAAFLEVDPQTVRSMHHKALTKLRAHFRDEIEQSKG
jgi:RNA polymerase sigma factor (sigma-70 family)